VKTSIGRLLGAPAGSIALVDSATRAWTQAFYAIALRPGDRILLSGVEYASNAVAAPHRAATTAAAAGSSRSRSTGWRRRPSATSSPPGTSP
jgi:cysteine desulfurase